MIIILCCITHHGQATLIDRNDELVVSSCQIYGDFHLWMYNQRLDQPRSLQWCKEEGDHLIYENEWIQIIITITKFPNWNEKYKMIFKEHNKILCTIHNTRNICDHR
ncbi:unnamed protein product, partial [Rotaria sordida]